MKTVVLATWLLVIGEVYAINSETVQSFNNYLTKCEGELGKSIIVPKEFRPDIIHCAFKKHGTIDEQGIFDKNKSIANCDDLVSDQAAVPQCKRIFTDCITMGFQYPGNNFNKALNIVMCAMVKGIMSLILRN